MSATMPNRCQAIADDIRRRIAAGELNTGERLPAETALASRYKVSTATLRNALALLQSEGLVEKSHGKGNFVGQPSHRLTYFGGVPKPLGTDPVDGRLRITVHATRLQARGDLIPLLRVPANTELTQYLCLHAEGKSPHSLARIYVPCEPSQRVTHGTSAAREGFESRTSDRRLPPTEIRERIAARLPTSEEVGLLQISSTLAVLDITRVTIDGTGRVIEAALLVFPSHRADAYFITRPMRLDQRREP